MTNIMFVIICVMAILVSGCQSSQSSNSSSNSTSSPSSQSTSQSTSTTTQEEQQQQDSSSDQESNDSETTHEDDASQSESGGSEYGEDLPSQGEPGEELPDPESSNQGLPGDVLSQEEAIAALDDKFDNSIAVFDGMIIGERAAAQAGQDEFPEEDESTYGDGSEFGNNNPLFEEADVNEDSDDPETGNQEGKVVLYPPDVGSSSTGAKTTSSRTGSRKGGIKTNMPARLSSFIWVNNPAVLVSEIL